MQKNKREKNTKGNSMLNKTLLLLLIFTLLFSACSENSSSTKVDDNPPEYINSQVFKILPVGDSRIEGDDTKYESYRYELWKLFLDNDIAIDFVGPYLDSKSYDSYKTEDFDLDHAGKSGATTLDVINTLDLITAIDSVDIILLGIGGNDFLQNIISGEIPVDDIIANVDSIIAAFKTAYPQADIIVEKIAPAQSTIPGFALLEPYFIDFNNQIKDVAAKYNESASEVIVVDMATDWKDSYMADMIHYNEEGAKIIAQRYFSKIETLIDY